MGFRCFRNPAMEFDLFARLHIPIVRQRRVILRKVSKGKCCNGIWRGMPMGNEVQAAREVEQSTTERRRGVLESTQLVSPRWRGDGELAS